jgi:hypothetical protein
VNALSSLLTEKNCFRDFHFNWLLFFLCKNNENIQTLIKTDNREKDSGFRPRHGNLYIQALHYDGQRLGEISPFGHIFISLIIKRTRLLAPGQDHLKNATTWLKVFPGANPTTFVFTATAKPAL